MSRISTTQKSRKMPSQERSRLTVDAIIQASTYILTEVGWKGFTTNAIAERAGVNISSLYQFFPNKEAIVAELQKRHAAEMSDELHKILQLVSLQGSLKQVLTLLVHMIVEKHKVAPAVHKAVLEEVPLTLKTSCSDADSQLRILFLEALKPFMQNVPNPELAIHIITVTAQALINNIIVERPKLLQGTEIVTELVALYEYYLERPTATTLP
ncbi:TetR/AcrR family transcriptional regulator [Shewanella profunda]|uniref:TetR/AcrR family transcriptional regulator n=1 Tax=Shewanella profunda TaxID=254793 RepID=UPI0020101BD4|nr:TetR/AcrR family transcriptional regulator [Shewanella profunda]MCL1090835.1 TetR/AcrR family transcriptional regulator [Shewanella profunda]